MSVADRDGLLAMSVPATPDDPCSQRYAVRRIDGRIELYLAQGSRPGPGAEPVFHGYPWRHPEFRPNPHPVPISVLRQLKGGGQLNEHEYTLALKDKLFT